MLLSIQGKSCACAAKADTAERVRRAGVRCTRDFAGGNQSSDGGLLLLRAAERKLGVCRRLAEPEPSDTRCSRW